ncbi:efflux transporter outer membrane subunit [Calditerrivibrio nitroreducens]|uniref:RND efflux system, outer membrane lipoprotein, NodT family n=1 Tax=Calditerrivibrio nitroreducens (strain DSM 19672 / NBRC 101217 / Yu37-1) TaxID=768670 RepID=E4TFL8_CALNY|nr:efflux transporter outer membrane subunit [Calditerrivibrio nitroreducens]ADR18486.1 RND efflux system, outer membrane lipoprotein, NodT family [Calditerrivibrio nitroreducens DSM 19672]
MKIGVMVPLLFLFFLSSCSFIPEYTKPDLPIPEKFPKDGVYTNINFDNSSEVYNLKWQEFFTDEKLKKIIELGLKNNKDLKIAAFNLESARLMYGIKRAELYPSLYGSGGVSRSRVSDDFSPKGKGSPQDQYSVNFGLAEWEIDFFGRIRSLKESALEQFFASKENKRAVQIALISELSRSYITLAVDRENYSITKKLYDIALENYKMVQSQYNVGLATEIDLNRAQIALDTIKVSLSNFEQIIELDKNAINYLVGDKVDESLLPDGLNNIMIDFSPNLSSVVLLNRPDIMAAEHQLKAANANIGAARAAIFPRISLLAGVGMASTELTRLFDSGSHTWNIGGNISLPLFDARVWQGYELSKVQKELYIAQYEKTIQAAFKEVMDLLVVRGTIDSQIQAQKNLINSLEKNYTISKQLYNQGVESFFSVLEATKNLLQAKQALLNLELAKRVNHVRLYSALGGGGNFEEEAENK